MNYLVATIKSWNVDQFNKLKENDKGNQWFLITEKEQLTFDFLQKINPRYIFFPHWSWIIREEIWRNYECVVFHMTDLPYGRGGTPLQNLILRGKKETKVSAIKVTAGLDAGDIYMKYKLDLKGRAGEIYKRLAKITFEKMIPKIIGGNLRSVKQKGRVVIFKRRKFEESELPKDVGIKKIYDHIRMLDAESYPMASLKYGKIRMEFTKANFKDGKLTAKVEFYEK